MGNLSFFRQYNERVVSLEVLLLQEEEAALFSSVSYLGFLFVLV
jgi:hypothetical protein